MTSGVLQLQARPGLQRTVGSLLDAVNNYRDWWRAWLRTPGFLREETGLTKQADSAALGDGPGAPPRRAGANLPYGEQRRLEIARALGTKPQGAAARRARRRHEHPREGRPDGAHPPAA
jgi:hypothetical protein